MRDLAGDGRNSSTAWCYHANMLGGLRRDAEALGALEDELRRNLYLFVRSQGRPVNRDDAAAATGISRKLAAFHLDKLVDRGLLTTSFARPPGRGGRGAGRTSKYYEPSDRRIDVTIPERRYDVLSSLLLRALRARSNDETGDCFHDAAMSRFFLPLHGSGHGSTLSSISTGRGPSSRSALWETVDMARTFGPA